MHLFHNTATGGHELTVSMSYLWYEYKQTNACTICRFFEVFVEYWCIVVWLSFLFVKRVTFFTFKVRILRQTCSRRLNRDFSMIIYTEILVITASNTTIHQFVLMLAIPQPDEIVCIILSNCEKFCNKLSSGWHHRKSLVHECGVKCTFLRNKSHEM